MDQYVFTFQGTPILLQAPSERLACCRAFHEVVTEFDVDPDRLQRVGWPDATDYSRIGDLSEPVILEGAE